jgi:hypothetical protein
MSACRRALVVAAVAAAACDRGAVEGEHRVRLSFQPGDGSTGLRTLEVKGQLSPGPGPSEAELNAFAASLRLVSRPDDAPVATQAAVTVVPAGTGPGGFPTAAMTTITVTAAGAQPEGWYHLLLGQLPPHTTLGNLDDHYVRADGTTAVRVHLGSQPLFWGIEACPKGSSLLVIVRFSEPVRADAGAPAPVAVASGSSGLQPCQMDSPADLARWACPVAQPGPAIQVKIGPGLRSLSGVPVGELETMVDIGNAAQGTDCRTMKQL